MGRHSSKQGDFTTMFEYDHRQDTLAGVGAVADQFTGRRESNGGFHRPRTSASNGTGMAALYEAAQQLASPVEAMMLSPMSSHQSMPTVPPVTVYAHYGYQSQQSSQYPPGDHSAKRQRYSGSSEGHQGPASGAPDGEHRCTVCDKTKKRECDLRWV